MANVAVGDQGTASWANRRYEVASGFTNVTIATGGTPVVVAVVFPFTFTNLPQVVCNVVNTSTPQNRAAAPSAITPSGCNIFGYSTTAGTIVVHWVAVGAP